MKVLIGAAIAALLIASTAAAQTPAPSPNCSGFTPAPSLPDGATSTRPQMTQGNEQYQAWGTERLAKLQSCRSDIDALRAQLNVLEAAFNSANAELNSVTTNWQAEVAEFNGRGHNGAVNREDRRSDQ